MAQCVECGGETPQEYEFISIPKTATVKKHVNMSGPEIIGARKWVEYTWDVHFDKERMKHVSFGFCDSCNKKQRKGYRYAALFWTILAVVACIIILTQANGDITGIIWVVLLWVFTFSFSLYSYKRKVTDSLVYSLMYEKGGFEKNGSPRHGHYYYIDGNPDINNREFVKKVMDDGETPHLFKVADYEKMLADKPSLVFKDMRTEVTAKHHDI